MVSNADDISLRGDVGEVNLDSFAGRKRVGSGLFAFEQLVDRGRRLERTERLVLLAAVLIDQHFRSIVLLLFGLLSYNAIHRLGGLIAVTFEYLFLSEIPYIRLLFNWLRPKCLTREHFRFLTLLCWVDIIDG